MEVLLIHDITLFSEDEEELEYTHRFYLGFIAHVFSRWSPNGDGKLYCSISNEVTHQALHNMDRTKFKYHVHQASMNQIPQQVATNYDCCTPITNFKFFNI